MAVAPQRLLALDTNLVLDLAEGLDAAHDFRETFEDRGYGFRLPPTAAVELRWKSLNDRDRHVRTLATRALAQLRAWDVQPLPELGEIEYAIVEAFVARLRLSRLLPDQEINDGFILGETSLAQIAALVTSDHHLLDMDQTALRLILEDADLPLVTPVHPRRLLKAIR
jgi:hypothetical protein